MTSMVGTVDCFINIWEENTRYWSVFPKAVDNVYRYVWFQLRYILAFIWNIPYFVSNRTSKESCFVWKTLKDYS